MAYPLTPRISVIQINLLKQEACLLFYFGDTEFVPIIFHEQSMHAHSHTSLQERLGDVSSDP